MNELECETDEIKNEQIGIEAENRFCVRQLESDRSIIPDYRSYYVDLKDSHYHN